MDVEELLRENFADRAERVGSPPHDLPERTRAGARRQRRQRIALASGVLALAVYVGGAAIVGATTDQNSAEPAVAGGPDAAGSSLYTAGTRGSLADDAEFVAGVAALDWDVGSGADRPRPPDAGSVRVVFAGEVPDGRRWALVMGRRGDEYAAAWFVGPPGAGAAALEHMGFTWPVDPEEPIALLDATEPRGPLVVVGLPGDTVEYHPGFFEEAPGRPGPMATALPATDGVAIAVVHRPEGNRFGRLWVTRGNVGYQIVPAQFTLNSPPVGVAD